MTDWSDWDAETRGFIFDPGVGLTVDPRLPDHWLSWDETVALSAWLAGKIAEAGTRVAGEGT